MERVDYESLIIQELLNFHRDKSLNVRPWYQRRSVWSTPQKAYLINTIFESKPVPTIYIRHQIDLDAEKSIKEVVDGQQRILTIISYKDDEFAAKHPNHKKKVTYSELSRIEKQDFAQTKLSVGYLIGANDSDVIEIFGRINSIAKNLNPQEKRNAQYSGEFKQFSLNEAVERLPFWRRTGIFTGNDIARMQEVQFISDLAINFMEGLTDFNADKITRYYKEFDEDFPRGHEVAQRFETVFAKLAAIDPEAFSETVFKQYQIAHTLMVAVDKSPHANPEKIEKAMSDIDALIRSEDDGRVSDAEAARYAEGFTGGNLHRIKTRSIRNEVLMAALA
ncbi:DUF262 domain-containing protein [Mesorhizobium sp. CO1-1-8]|uniref:DUF262 domain-containing protein n=1 Tax=Mesorhizobium sp. CO1-1-8 TaxID=2876631 RepID=UPI001CD08FE6|nr:DUF262 domain-containing protein [Mesorhizobium sp. CO1-1-8]MBZ9776030.1 DUF262 domain-containing protein [Mesorhizobium sp. CO1-1-8]